MSDTMNSEDTAVHPWYSGQSSRKVNSGCKKTWLAYLVSSNIQSSRELLVAKLA
jgi:hypothetical protein